MKLTLALTLAATLTFSLFAQDHAVRIRYTRTDEGGEIEGHGTAFWANLEQYGYAGNHYLISVAHNILSKDAEPKPYSTLQIEVNGKWYPCSAVGWDSKLDLCVIKAGSIAGDPLELSGEDARPGDHGTLEGSPGGDPIETDDAIVMERYYDGEITSLVKVKFSRGDSGGPLITGGKVSGVAVAGIPKDGDLDHRVGKFIPTSVVRSFLEKLAQPAVANK